MNTHDAPPSTTDSIAPAADTTGPGKQKGKAGLALLMWLLGVPGSIVLLYVLFGR